MEQITPGIPDVTKLNKQSHSIVHSLVIFVTKEKKRKFQKSPRARAEKKAHPIQSHSEFKIQKEIHD